MKKKSSRGKGILYGILICLALFLMGAFALWNMQIEEVNVKGVDYYTEEEIESFLFQTPMEKNVLYAMIMDRLGEKKTIPFVSGYQLHFEGLKKVTVTVYEKKIVGYIDFMGSHMYFDKDGTVVESTKEVYEGVPQIAGLEFPYMVLSQTLPVKETSIFIQILNLTQMVADSPIVKEYHQNVEKIYFDNMMNATLYVGEIRVLLGSKENMEDKIALLSGILPEISGLKGVLHLENYDKTAINPYYSFRPDPVKESTNTDETGSSE